MRITVYAGSALGNQAIYQEAAAAFAKQLVAEGHEIVYGGERPASWGSSPTPPWRPAAGSPE